MPTSVGYLEMFRRIETWTYDLQKGDNLAILQGAGFHWIRRIPQRFERMVRNPTIGCQVELYQVEHAGCVHLDSPMGRKLVKQQCYF
jgi:hypothetical protein